jgi:hypothetical protein
MGPLQPQLHREEVKLMNETTATAAPDRASIRSELDSLETAYRDLVGEIADSHWKSPSGNRAWTCGQLAWHLASGLGFSSRAVANARKGKGTNIPSFLMPLGLKANEFQTRLGARRATRESVLSDIEAGFARLRSLVDGIEDRELTLSATNFGETRTIEQMFRIPKEHFEEHGPEIRFGLARP